MANLNLRLDVLNLEPVKEVTGVLVDMLNDERIPEDIRQEYKNRVDAIEWKEPDSV